MLRLEWTCAIWPWCNIFLTKARAYAQATVYPRSQTKNADPLEAYRADVSAVY